MDLNRTKLCLDCDEVWEGGPKVMLPAAIIIPARWDSSRLPYKPLASINGYPMIQWVWSAAKKAAAADCPILIATDSEPIQKVCEDFGAEVELTDLRHPNGSSRCLEVCEKYGWEDKDTNRRILILQGDEPMMEPWFLKKFLELTCEGSVTGFCSWLHKDDKDDPNVVKAVLTDDRTRAIGFSRKWTPGAYRHIGIYMHSARILRLLVKGTKPGPLEKEEGLEQLRLVEIGGWFYTVEWTDGILPISVDTPMDLEKVRTAMKGKRLPQL